MFNDNHSMLKVINLNKMQHQYIQNLQRANMTLKCKIKEMSEVIDVPGQVKAEEPKLEELEVKS